MAKEIDRDDEDEESGDKEAIGVRGHAEISGQEAEVDITDVDDEGGDEERPSKKDRRNARYSELEERLRASEERATRVEQELSAARQRADAEAARTASQVEAKDEYEDRIKQLTESRAAKLQLIRRTIGDEHATAALARESLDLEGQISDLRMERAIKKHGASQKAPEVNVERKLLEAEFPQVYSDPRVHSYASGEFLRMVARGAPQTIETARKANKTALQDMGLERPSTTAPTAAQQLRHGGQRSSNGGAAPVGGKVKLTGALRKIARARSAILSPDDDEGVAEKKMAKRLRENNIA